MQPSQGARPAGRPFGVRGVKIPEGTVIWIRQGDCMRALNGPQQGQIEPMTSDERAAIARTTPHRGAP